MTNMTQPVQPSKAPPAISAGNASGPPKAPPADPRQQAVDFAIKLASFRTTMTPNMGTTVEQLLSDAAQIRDFLRSGA